MSVFFSSGKLSSLSGIYYVTEVDGLFAMELSCREKKFSLLISLFEC